MHTTTRIRIITSTSMHTGMTTRIRTSMAASRTI